MSSRQCHPYYRGAFWAYAELDKKFCKMGDLGRNCNVMELERVALLS